MSKCLSKYSMFREETGEFLVLSSSYICCHTHSSSALPTRFSPLLLEFKHNLHRAWGLWLCKRSGSIKTEPISPLCTLLETLIRALCDLASFWQTVKERFALGCLGELPGQSPCVLQAGTAHGSGSKGYSGVVVREWETPSGREAHRNAKQHRRMGNDSCPRGLEEEYPISA